jgi:hypothetical protein
MVKIDGSRIEAECRRIEAATSGTLLHARGNGIVAAERLIVDVFKKAGRPVTVEDLTRHFDRRVWIVRHEDSWSWRGWWFVPSNQAARGCYMSIDLALLTTGDPSAARVRRAALAAFVGAIFWAFEYRPADLAGVGADPHQWFRDAIRVARRIERKVGLPSRPRASERGVWAERIRSADEREESIKRNPPTAEEIDRGLRRMLTRRLASNSLGDLRDRLAAATGRASTGVRPRPRATAKRARRAS